MSTNKVVFVGDPAVGKTHLIGRAMDLDLSNISQSTGVTIHPLTVKTRENDPVSLSVWDTPGQDSYQTMTPLHVRSAKAVVICFDVSDGATFKSVPHWYDMVSASVAEAAFFIVGNKIDQESVVSDGEAQDYAKTINAMYYKTSAFSAEGVTELFMEIASHMGPNVIEPDTEIRIDDDSSHTGSIMHYFSCCT
jgi:small GTP-binding protein